MPWLQLHFNVDKSTCEALETLLFEHGAQTITLVDAQDEAQFEPAPGETPLWSLMTLSALFDAQLSPQKLLTELSQSSDAPLPSCDIEILEDKDWEREWMSSYKPIQMGQRLWICPSWLKAPDENAVNLILDPGLAFGTGTHPTTALCLEWLDQQAQQDELHNKSVIDYGCGSGILAIAALLLGAKHTTAIDHDPQAIIATQDNALKNKINSKQLASYHSADEPRQLSCDILIANILSRPLLQLYEKFVNFCKKGDKLILSGILNVEQKIICDQYQQDFIIINISAKDDWLRIDCIKK